MKIEVSSTEREVFIRFDEITHFRFDRKEILGLQSWIIPAFKGPVYGIRLYVKSNQEIHLEYDTREKWIEVLDGLDGTPFLA